MLITNNVKLYNMLQTDISGAPAADFGQAPKGPMVRLSDFLEELAAAAPTCPPVPQMDVTDLMMMTNGIKLIQML